MSANLPIDLLIAGAGPVGLEAALAAAEAGLEFCLVEAGDRAGANVRSWGHVRMFSSWELNVSARMRAALARGGVEVPEGGANPTGDELAARLLDPLARLPAVATRLRLGHRVVAIGKSGLHKAAEIGTPRRAAQPFRALVDTPGGEAVWHARAVLDCTGNYEVPLWLGDGGVPAPGERAQGSRIVRRLPDFAADPERWCGRTVLLAGAGHSAQTAATALATLAARATTGGRIPPRVIWALRRAHPQILDQLLPAGDPLPERGALHVRAIALIEGRHPAVEARLGATVESMAAAPEPSHQVLVRLRRGDADGFEEIAADEVLALVGTCGDRALYAELHVHECYATCGPIKLAAKLLGEGNADCLAQASGDAEELVNPEPGFFVLGSKSYGRNSAFLMRVGYEQVASVMPHLIQHLSRQRSVPVPPAGDAAEANDG
ncbi:MAG TPA: hypothetical protein VNB06_15770 [Thermoanaerobaculia bacterium]|nr:hypothetical protein [Thermoanaerobaculia bacterium]